MDTIGITNGRRNERPAETPDLIPGYFARIDKGNLLTHREEIDLSKRAKAGDDRARKKLVEKNSWSALPRGTGGWGFPSRT
jgi:DNA-directed RNA polymerase sigma subunit (sigma70/sigma32)